MELKSDNASTIGVHAIEGTIERLAHNPLNDLPNEVYQASVKAGWEDQWLNWDDLGDDDPGWGDIGD